MIFQLLPIDLAKLNAFKKKEILLLLHKFKEILVKICKKIWHSIFSVIARVKFIVDIRLPRRMGIRGINGTAARGEIILVSSQRVSWITQFSIG